MTVHSTEDVPHNQFKPHGRAHVSIESNQLAVYRADGPFNLEFLEALQKIEPIALKELKSNHQKWVELVVFENNCTATFEFFTEYETYLVTSQKNEMAPIASAFVIHSDLEGAHLIIKKLKLCFEHAGIPWRVFEYEKDARFWLDTIFEESLAFQK